MDQSNISVRKPEVIADSFIVVSLVSWSCKYVILLYTLLTT